MTLNRQFWWLSRAWYADATLRTADYVDEVCFGLYGDSGTNEMLMRWYKLRIGEPATPKLEVFSDAWGALHEMQDLLAELANRDDQDITPNDFCELLKSLGFVDKTPYTQGGVA